MTTDLLPKTRRLISRSACPRELSDYAEWLLAEGYTPAPIHLHLTYLDQALARIARPHDLRPRDVADVERAFKSRGGPASTTMRYARADLDLKRQAIAQVFPDALAPPRGGHLLLDGRDLVGWLRRM